MNLRKFGLALSAVPIALGGIFSIPDRAATAAEATVSPGKTFSFVGIECPEPAATFFVDGDVAQRQVPEPFKVARDALGRATLIVAAANCGEIELNGKPAGAALLSDVGVVINSPDPSEPPGQHIYQLWQVTTNHDLRQEMKQLGMLGEQVPGATFVPFPKGVSVQFTADFTSSKLSPYLLKVIVPPPVPVPPGSNTWWHLGDKGVLRIRYSFLNADAVPGAATVRATAGSRLAELLGSTEKVADVGSHTVHHRYEGTIEIVNLAGS
jgi:hypothetical protein